MLGGMLGGMLDGIFDEMLDGMFGGMFGGIFNGISVQCYEVLILPAEPTFSCYRKISFIVAIIKKDSTVQCCEALTRPSKPMARH